MKRSAQQIKGANLLIMLTSYLERRDVHHNDVSADCFLCLVYHRMIGLQIKSSSMVNDDREGSTFIGVFLEQLPLHSSPCEFSRDRMDPSRLESSSKLALMTRGKRMELICYFIFHLLNLTICMMPEQQKNQEETKRNKKEIRQKAKDI